MRKYIFIAVCFILFSCGEEKTEATDIIPREKFKSLLVEMYRLEGEVSGQTLIDDKADSKFRSSYYQLFQKNGTDSLQVRKTLEYYGTRPEDFKILMQEVNTSLRNLQQ